MDSIGFINNLKDIVKFINDKNIIENPISNYTQNILKETKNEIYIYENSDEEKELLEILNNPFLNELCLAHDKIAKKEYSPVLVSIPNEVDEDEEISVKFCTLIKSSREPLGATIKQLNSQTNESSFIIARIMDGGSIDRTDALEVGDQIKQINDKIASDYQPEEIIELLAPADGILNMIVQPSLKYYCETCLKNAVNQNETLCETCSQTLDINNDEALYVRALFNYNPRCDRSHVCDEAGLELHIGDILEICDYKNDQNWWQARLVASPLVNNAPTLNEKSKISFNENKIEKPVASLIPSKYPINENNDTNNIPNGMLPYEELCIFDPVTSYPLKRAITIVFAYNDQIVNSFNTTKLEYPLSFYQCVSKILTHLQKPSSENNSFLLFELPKFYRYQNSNKHLTHNKKFNSLKIQKSSSAPSSPSVNHHRIQEHLNGITKLVENYCTNTLSKDEFDFDNENLIECVFDDYSFYKIDEMLQLFLDYGEQLVYFPKLKDLLQLRDSCMLGKLSYHVFFNIKSEQFNNNNSKQNELEEQFDFQFKYLFDFRLNITNENLNEALMQFDKTIVKVNQMPSYVIK